MDYIQLSFLLGDANGDILIAKLTDIGYEGFEETGTELKAFIPANDFDEGLLNDCIDGLGVSYTKETIVPQNWNAVWERSFEPVVVPGFCTVRADFHEIDIQTPYEIIITPKMSFGTGHHATTMLMMQQMQHLDFTGKRVFDFGTGTGILAILAEKLGANEVLAIDNDEWCYENIQENIARNTSANVEALIGSLENIPDQEFDIILANINRHILLMYMGRLYELLKEGGKILMSGLLKEDYDIILKASEAAGFKLSKNVELNNWIILIFEKQHT